MSYIFDWRVIYDYRGMLLEGLWHTCILSFYSIKLSFVVGIALALCRQFLPRSISWLFVALIEIFRNIPPIVQFFFWYFAIGLDGLTACVVGLSAFTATHIAEIVRSGLNTVHKSQTESARASGLTLMSSVFWIILPQSLLRMMPALAGEVVNIVKDSSIAMTIGYAELSFSAQEIEANTFRGFESATAVTVIYGFVGLCVLICMHGVERYLKRDVRI